MDILMVSRFDGLLLLTLFVISLTSGCSRSDAPPLGKVSGVVTLNGKPVPNASVTFIPTEGGRPASGETNNNGEYTLTFSSSHNGAKVGKNQVFIGTARDASAGNPAVKEAIPPRYNLKSELFVDVQNGTNRLDFHLEASETELAELAKTNSATDKSVVSE